METTILIAKLLGAYFAVSGLFILTRRKTLSLVLKDFFDHRAIVFVVGAIMTIGGAALVLRGDTGNDALSVFIKIISWAILLKGVAYILVPEWLHGFVRKMPKQYLPVIGLVIGAIGVYILVYVW